MEQNPLIFTSPHIDGLVSYLIYAWTHSPSQLSLPVIIRANENLDRYCNVIEKSSKVLCFDVFLREHMEKVFDAKHITIYDTHTISESYVPRYQLSKVYVVPKARSCSYLLYKVFEHTYTPAQKLLIHLTKDISEYKFTVLESYDLQLLYQNRYKSKITDFLKDFRNGFTGFTQEHRKFIADTKKALCQSVKKLKLFSGTVEFNHKKYKCLSVLADHADVSALDFITLNDVSYDIVFWVNTTTQRINIRRSPAQTVDLKALADYICDGDGHSYSAAGKITDVFLEHSKSFTPCSISC